MRKLIELIERHCPGFSSEIVPTTNYEMDWFRRTVSRPFPPPFLEFLRLMGTGMGSLQIDEVNLFFRSIHETHMTCPTHPPDRYILFGLGTAGDDRDYYFDSEQPKRDDFVVVSITEPPYREWRPFDPRFEFASFREMMFFFGFRNMCVRRLPFHTVLHTSRRSPKGVKAPALARKLDDIAQQLNARILPEAEICRLYEAEDFAMSLHLNPETDWFELDIGAAKQRRLDQFLAVFDDTLGLTEDPSLPDDE